MNVQNVEEGNEDVAYQYTENSKKGGFRATYFVYAMMMLDHLGFVANMAGLVLYFLYVIKFDTPGAAITTTNYLGTAFLLTLLGGFISDTYMTRHNTCILFAAIEIMGYLLLVIQSHYTKLQPEKCLESTCVHGTKALLFYTSIYLLALGGGGVRGALPALGADQFDYNNPKESKNVATFFNWFLLSITIGASVGVTVVVWVSMNVGWDKGFIISLICCFGGLCFIFMGKPFYRNRVPGNSPLLTVFQVLVAATRNWRKSTPTSKTELYEIPENSDRIQHTDQFKILDKAAIINSGGKQSKWKVCTITQVEEVKVLTRMMPILLSTTLMNTCLAQLQTVSVQQGTLMDTKLGSFNVPAASIPIIPLAFMSLLIPVYEFAFVPIMRKITGHRSGITYLQRIGVGLVLSAISMGIAGAVEVKRKNELRNGHKISLFWLGIHYAIYGVADLFTLAGLMDFFYSEAPAGMRSLSTSFSWVSLSIGFFLSSIFVQVTNSVSGRFTSSKTGWLEGRDLNKNKVEFFYWFLAVLNVVNFGNYLFWAKWYKYKKDVSSPVHIEESNGSNGFASYEHQDPSLNGVNERKT